MGRVDVALEEFKALRTELIGHQQAQTTIVSIALTATAAIAGVAFGGGGSDDKERLEIFLALPLFLSGLALAYLAHSYGSVAIGDYIRDQLWPQLQAAPADQNGGGVA